jgi:NAD(P)-dependent dehydrogenase (short-subunit alcohol dehydrogenase family)
MEGNDRDDSYDYWLQSMVVGTSTIAALYFASRFLQKKGNPDSSMKGQVCVVTGGNRGIGFAAARALASRGAKVVLGCRDIGLGNSAAESISKMTANTEVTALHLDLSNFSSIQKFAKKIDKCHILVNNAATMVPSHDIVHGVESTSFVNHLGPFYLTMSMLPKLQKTADDDNVVTRIVNVSSRLEKHSTPNLSLIQQKSANVSDGSQSRTQANDDAAPLNFDSDVSWIKYGPKPYNMWTSYANSKLCNLLMTFELSKRLKLSESSSTSTGTGTGTAGGSDRVSAVTVNAVTPGMVNTDLSRWAPWWQRTLSAPLRALLLRTPDAGAAPIVALCTRPVEALPAPSGGYYADADLKPVLASPAARSDALATAVWQESERILRAIESESESDQGKG